MPPVEHSALQMSGVTFARRGERILGEIDWEVRTGERWIVLGPNGAGKTTLLQLAATYEVPSTGTIDVLGSRVGTVDVRELRKRIGYVSQVLARAVPPRTSALDVVVMGRDANLRRWRQEYVREDLERAGRLLDLLGCGQLREHDFEKLSEGERQRVLIARSLMGDVDLLLLDEPTAGLDLAGREQLIGSLQRLAGDPSTSAIVFVTHHVEEIPRGFTHVLLLRNGTVAHAGRIGDTLTDENLSDVFEMPVRLMEVEGRFMATSTGPANLRSVVEEIA